MLPCADVAATSEFFTGRLGFWTEMVVPADDPRTVVLCGHGVRLRLQRADEPATVTLRIACDRPERLAGGDTELVAPNGARVVLVPREGPPAVPTLRPSFVVSRNAEASWVMGRAGMRYRDLIPGRQGGRFVASHIVIDDAGPVPDYVHFHVVRAQLIHCLAGWVRLIYEDQGPPFVMEAGDCVLQPPRIRHRVLECSAGLQVLEVGCPAVHETWADREMTLPTASHSPERRFDGQHFAWHRASHTAWAASSHPGWEVRPTGLGAASAGSLELVALRPGERRDLQVGPHDAELRMLFVRTGQVTLRVEGLPVSCLSSADAVVIPAGLDHALLDASDDLELVEVTATGSRPPCT